MVYAIETITVYKQTDKFQFIGLFKLCTSDRKNM